MKFLFLHLWLEYPGCQIPKDQRGCDSGCAGFESSCEDPDHAIFFYRFFYTTKQRIAKSQQRYACTCSGKFLKWFIYAKESEYCSTAHSQYHNASRHQLGSIQQNLNTCTDQSTHPECFYIIHLLHLLFLTGRLVFQYDSMSDSRHALAFIVTDS